MTDAVSQTTPPEERAAQKLPWAPPAIIDLPKLTALTLASPIGGGGGTGGSTVF